MRVSHMATYMRTCFSESQFLAMEAIFGHCFPFFKNQI